jgi:hypothetical protein
MRRIPAGLLALFATVALAVTAPAAGAHGLKLVPASAGGQSPGELLGDIWVGSLSGRHLPYLGTCTTYERIVLVPHPTAENTPIHCTMRQDQSVFFAWGAFCGTFDGLYTRAKQLACALEYDREIQSITVSVDGGVPVDFHSPRFEFATPQRWVWVAAGNDFELPPQLATFTAHGWAALLKGLRPGPHRIVRTATVAGFDEPAVQTVLVSVTR